MHPQEGITEGGTSMILTLFIFIKKKYTHTQQICKYGIWFKTSNTTIYHSSEALC